MSTRYNTGNPIESTDVRDMSDNAKNFDEFANLAENSFIDRFGVTRKTIYGMNSEFDGQILNMGYARIGTFATGGTLTSPRQTLLWDIADGGDGQEYGWSGNFPKAVPAGSNPNNTGGIAVGAWMSRFDPELRIQVREALRRSYAEAGYNVVGTFQEGFTIVNANDVGIDETTGKGFTGPAGPVAAGTDPASGGFVDVSGNSGSTHVDIIAFGVVGDGVASDDNALTAAVVYANSHNLKLVCPPGRRVKLTGSSTIAFQTDVDFNGSVLDVSGFSGLIKFLRREVPVEYGPTSSVVTALKAEAQLTGKVWAGWVGVAEVEDSFIIIETSQPFYTFRGVPQNRVELNKVNRYGMVESALKYPLDPNTITKITVHPIEKKWTIAENIVFDVGTNDVSNAIVHIESSLFLPINWRFIQGDFVNTSTNPVYVRIASSCHVYVERLYFQWAGRSTSSTGFTYNIAPELSYDVSFSSVRAPGDGWGAMAGNTCQKITFEKCNLSRIDFHHPFRELLKIKDCDIGSWGVLVTALGDLVIEGGSMVIEQQAYTNNQGFVRSREDSGGFCDGNLIVCGVALRDETISQTRRLAQHQFSSGNPKPSGSPISYQFWRAVSIDDVRYVGGVLQLLPGVVASSGIAYPDSVSIRNCLDGLFYIEELGFGGITEPTALVNTPVSNPIINPFNVQISVENSRARSIRLREQGTQRFSISLKVSHLHGRKDGANSVVELVYGGLANFTDSEIEGFDFFAGAAVDKRLKVSFKGGAIRHTGAENPNTLLNGVNSLVDISVSDAVINVASGAVLQTLLSASLKGNTYYIGSAAAAPIYAVIDFSSNATQPLTNPALNLGNAYKLLSGFDGDGTAKVTAIVIPTPGNTHYYPISATQSISLARSSDGLSIAATVTGAAVARNIYLA